MKKILIIMMLLLLCSTVTAINWNFRQTTTITTEQNNIESVKAVLNIINSDPMSNIFFTRWGYDSFIFTLTDNQEVYFIKNNEGKLELTNEIKGDYLSVDLSLVQANKSIKEFNSGDRIASLNEIHKSVKIPFKAKMKALYILFTM